MANYTNIGEASVVGGNVRFSSVGVDAVFARDSLAVRDDGEARIVLPEGVEAAWFHWRQVREGAGISSQIGDAPVTVYNTNSNILFQYRTPENRVPVTVDHRVGGKLRTNQDVFNLGSNIALNFDLLIVVGAGSGEVRLYVDERLMFRQINLNNTGGDIGWISFRSSDHDGNSAASRYFFTEFLVGIGVNSPTVGRRVSAPELSEDE